MVFNCANLEDIKRALRLLEEFKLNGFLAGVNEAWRVAGLVKQAKIPLLVSLDFKPPFTSSFANQGDELKEKAEATYGEVLKKVEATTEDLRHRTEEISAKVDEVIAQGKQELAKITKKGKAGEVLAEAAEDEPRHAAEQIGEDELEGQGQPHKHTNHEPRSGRQDKVDAGAVLPAKI